MGLAVFASVIGAYSKKRNRKKKWWWLLLFAMLFIAIILAGCDGEGTTPPPPEPDTPEPQPTETPSPSPDTPTPPPATGEGAEDHGNGKTPQPDGQGNDSERCPSPTPEVKWLEGTFKITHYTFALESDPKYADDEKVSAKGLPSGKKYREGFLYGEHGILMQGTGLAEDGKYITIDWTDGPQGRDTTFTYGIGGAYADPVAWQTVATGDSRLSAGTEIVIETYRDKGVFTVADTGGGVGEHHIDVFVGAITIDEANNLGTKRSRVGIVQQ
jgi:3D (Asp-Asp-Asp) domain-containing protein